MTGDTPGDQGSDIARQDGPIEAAQRDFAELIQQYDPKKRPHQAFRLWTLIIGLIAAFGVLGYAVPALFAKVWK